MLFRSYYEYYFFKYKYNSNLSKEYYSEGCRIKYPDLDLNLKKRSQYNRDYYKYKVYRNDSVCYYNLVVKVGKKINEKDVNSDIYFKYKDNSKIKVKKNVIFGYYSIIY